MTTTETQGNERSIDCPWCGKPIRDLWDYGNSLDYGLVFACEHCFKEIVLKAVDISISITAARKEQAE